MIPIENIPQNLDALLDALSVNEPNNLRIIELISTSDSPEPGVERFNQTYEEETESVIFGFDSIKLNIKEK